jgi:hypothetical protein
VFEPGSDYPEMLALYLGLLDADFTVVDSPELVSALRTLAGRFQRAIEAGSSPMHPSRPLSTTSSVTVAFIAEHSGVRESLGVYSAPKSP